MRYIILLLLFSILPFASAEFQLELKAEKDHYFANEVITLNTNFKTPQDAPQVWDTYLFFMDSRLTPTYIIVVGNRLQPTPLGMLPKKIRLKPQNWRKNECVRFFLCVCKSQSQDVVATATTIVKIDGEPGQKLPQLPAAPELRLLLELAKTSQRGYTNYKQFDSRWKTVLLNKGPKTIGQIGCAMTAAGNIISWTPKNLNKYLKDNGGYYGNSIIWGKVPGISYKGSGSISDSLFSSYHVIANVGGHFVLLTGKASSGSYYSHDPGKSSNPIYKKSQIYSVRLYYK